VEAAKCNDNVIIWLMWSINHNYQKIVKKINGHPLDKNIIYYFIHTLIGQKNKGLAKTLGIRNKQRDRVTEIQKYRDTRIQRYRDIER
jgi:hypothetical protein